MVPSCVYTLVFRGLVGLCLSLARFTLNIPNKNLRYL